MSIEATYQSPTEALPVATTTTPGMMSAADKTKLDGINTVSDISTHNSSGTAHSDIRTLVSAAQSTADAALPKSGGTMTGTLTMGTNAISMGGASLAAASSVLSYGGKELEAVEEIGQNYIRYKSGLQICWGFTNSMDY